MSIEALCTGDTVFKQTKTSSIGAIGGNAGSWNTDFGSGVDCRVDQLRRDEDMDFNAQGQRITHQVFFSKDQSLDNDNRLHWKKTSGNTRSIDLYLKVEDYYWEDNPDGSLQLFIADCILQTTAMRQA